MKAFFKLFKFIDSNFSKNQDNYLSDNIFIWEFGIIDEFERGFFIKASCYFCIDFYEQQKNLTTDIIIPFVNHANFFQVTQVQTLFKEISKNEKQDIEIVHTNFTLDCDNVIIFDPVMKFQDIELLCKQKIEAELNNFFNLLKKNKVKNIEKGKAYAQEMQKKLSSNGKLLNEAIDKFNSFYEKDMLSQEIPLSKENNEKKLKKMINKI